MERIPRPEPIRNQIPRIPRIESALLDNIADATAASLLPPTLADDVRAGQIIEAQIHDDGSSEVVVATAAGDRLQLRYWRQVDMLAAVAWAASEAAL